MILELMPSRAETYHVFLKTIACSVFIAYIPEYFILPLICVLFVNSWSIATSCPHMHKIFNPAYGDGFSSTFTADCVVLQEQQNNKLKWKQFRDWVILTVVTHS